jgi:hypothetical protein
VGDIDPAAGLGQDAAIAFAGETRVRFLRTWFQDGLHNIALDLDELAIPTEVPEGTGIALADVEGDGHLDLLLPSDGDLLVMRGDGARGFGAAELAYPGVGWPLAIGDLDGDGAADYVLADGIWIRDAGALVRRGAPPPGLTVGAAVIAELNGEPPADVMWALAGQPLVELRLGDVSGVFGSVSFETEGIVAGMRAGDFDADLVGDVALSSAAPGGDVVSVYFGDRAGPFAPPTLISRFEHIDRIEAARFTLPGLPEDLSSDLIVTSRADEIAIPGEPIAIDVLFGSPVRLMVSALDLGADPRLLVTGRFDDDPRVDVLTITDELQGARLQLVLGRGSARFHAGDRRLIECDAIDGGAFDPYAAVWTVGDPDRDGVDQLVGVAAGTLFDGGRVRTPDRRLVLHATLTPLGSAATPSSVRLVDLDRDGSEDLLLVYDGDSVAVHWNEDGRFEAGRRTALPGAWTGAAAINADGDADPELALIAPVGAFVVEIVDRELVQGDAAIVVGGGERIWGGDLDGDRIDDVIVGGGPNVQVFRAIPHDEAR